MYNLYVYKCIYRYRKLWYGFPPGIVNGFDSGLYPSISYGTNGSQGPQMHVGKLENRHGKAICVITLGAFCIKLSTMRRLKCWESWPIPYCSNPKAVLRDSEKYADNQDTLSQCFIVSPAMMDTPKLPFHLGKYHRRKLPYPWIKPDKLETSSLHGLKNIGTCGWST
jgi:hypothetical protein